MEERKNTGQLEIIYAVMVFQRRRQLTKITELFKGLFIVDVGGECLSTGQGLERSHPNLVMKMSWMFQFIRGLLQMSLKTMMPLSFRKKHSH